MKILHSPGFHLILFLFILTGTNYGQESLRCKVLIPDLDSIYTGECKKGLAHGQGEAKGKDAYIGEFKKGYPHGSGTYYYANGAVYTGDFLQGKRHGTGKLTYWNDNNEITEQGIWEDDNYIGEKPVPPYEITLKHNVLRYTFVKSSDPRNMVMVKIYRNGARIYPETLMLSGSSGSMVQNRSFTGYDQVQFPFHGTIKYSLLAAFQSSSSTTYELGFTINSPGSWEITLSH